MYKKEILPNGVRVILIPQKETKAVTALTLFGVGSRYESKKLNGISHFIEHMMFKGTKKRPDTLTISRDLDSVGADYNAFTSKNHTGYYVKVNQENLELALDILNDMLFNSKYDQDDLERERGVIIEEVNMYEDSPMMYIDDLFEKNLYNDSSLGRLIIGPRENIKRFSREEMIAYRDNFYQPKNVVLILAGNLGKNPLELVKKYFGNLEQTNNNKKTFDKFEIDEKKNIGPKLSIKFKETEQVHLAIGFPTFSHDDERIYALSLLSVILGGNMSSRLFINIREKQGLCYYIHSESQGYHDVGNLRIQAGLDKSRIKEAITLILKELKDVLDNGIADEELKRTKEYIKGKTILALEDSSNLAGFFGKQELLNKEVLTPEEKFAKIEKVTKEEIQKVAKDIIKEERLRGAIIGPFKEEKEFLDLLKI